MNSPVRSDLGVMFQASGNSIQGGLFLEVIFHCPLSCGDQGSVIISGLCGKDGILDPCPWPV